LTLRAPRLRLLLLGCHPLACPAASVAGSGHGA